MQIKSRYYLYFKYNYKFRINPNIKNTENLKIQSEYGKVEEKINKLVEKILDKVKIEAKEQLNELKSYHDIRFNK